MAPTQTALHPWHRTSPRLGTDEEFAALRRLLRESGYTDEGICQRLEVEDLAQYSATSAPERPLELPLDGLIRLFFDCVRIDEQALARLLPPGSVELLKSLNL